MTSKLTNTVNRVLGTDVNDADIFNNVRDGMIQKNPAYAYQLPKYQAGQSFIPWGQTFNTNPQIFNDYLDSLAVKYGVVFQKAFIAQNPLRFFRRGTMPFGGKIETVVYDTIEPKMYRPDLLSGEDNVFAQNYGRIVGHTYCQYQDIEAANTIVDTQDTMYFQNITQFNDFVYGKITQLVNGAILDEYRQTKEVLAKSYADGMMTDDSAATPKELAQKILYWAKMLRYFSPDNNADGVTQATLVDDLVVIIPAKYNVQLSTDYFANVFNMEQVQNEHIKYVEIDSFPDIWEYSADHTVTMDDINGRYVSAREYKVGDVIPKGNLARVNAPGAVQVLDGDTMGAVILDRDALQLWDSLPLTLSAIANPKKRYTNIFMNKKTALMFVQSLNSKVIKYTGADSMVINSSFNDPVKPEPTYSPDSMVQNGIPYEQTANVTGGTKAFNSTAAKVESQATSLTPKSAASAAPSTSSSEASSNASSAAPSTSSSEASSKASSETSSEASSSAASTAASTTKKNK